MICSDPTHLAAIDEIEIFLALGLRQPVLFDELLDLRPTLLAILIFLALAVQLGIARGLIGLRLGPRFGSPLLLLFTQHLVLGLLVLLLLLLIFGLARLLLVAQAGG